MNDFDASLELPIIAGATARPHTIAVPETISPTRRAGNIRFDLSAIRAPARDPQTRISSSPALRRRHKASTPENHRNSSFTGSVYTSDSRAENDVEEDEDIGSITDRRFAHLNRPSPFSSVRRRDGPSLRTRVCQRRNAAREQEEARQLEDDPSHELVDELASYLPSFSNTPERSTLRKPRMSSLEARGLLNGTGRQVADMQSSPPRQVTQYSVLSLSLIALATG